MDAIIQATTQVLLEQGYDRFTTVRAAERAGVSVGSLYQYFPNKAALASAVIERCCGDFLIAFESALVGGGQGTLADCIRGMIDGALRCHRLPPELHRMVLELVPRIGAAGKTKSVSQSVAKSIEAALRRHSDEIRPDVDISMAAMVIEAVLEELAHRAVLAHPMSLEVNLLSKEAARLIQSYLTRTR